MSPGSPATAARLDAATLDPVEREACGARIACGFEGVAGAELEASFVSDREPREYVGGGFVRYLEHEQQCCNRGEAVIPGM